MSIVIKHGGSTVADPLGGEIPARALLFGRVAERRRSVPVNKLNPWPPEEFCNKCARPRLISFYIDLCMEMACEGGRYEKNDVLAHRWRDGERW